MKSHEIEACMHFSAFAFVGESVEKPQIYYQNNFVETLHLLDVLIENDVKKFIFLQPAQPTVNRSMFRLTKRIRSSRPVLMAGQNLWLNAPLLITTRLTV
ncbi:MAG: GDP-mannose 4,6-dehydratase [Pyrinomonadaceae bacterium]